MYKSYLKDSLRQVVMVIGEINEELDTKLSPIERASLMQVAGDKAITPKHYYEQEQAERDHQEQLKKEQKDEIDEIVDIAKRTLSKANAGDLRGTKEDKGYNTSKDSDEQEKAGKGNREEVKDLLKEAL